ncbi:MAG: dihydropteroate synthase [Spirochaetes bacterium]|nr:dihydropteroate synthase [Spirochaetota bacterium]
MGVINITPDSFFPFSRKKSVKKAVLAAIQMASDGADIIDIGGESTRPGSGYIDEQEELGRVIPALKEIALSLKIPVSVDTRKSRVAYEAIKAGASIVNDISSLEDDPAMAEVVKDAGCDIIIMHKKGTPSDMQENTFYADIIKEIYQKLENLTENAVSKGIDENKITIDPGVGFGKKGDDNLVIINNITYFKRLGFPVLIGHSRKSFIGTVTGRVVEERLAGSLAAGVVSLINGADILRVHDVKETLDTVKIVEALRHGRSALAHRTPARGMDAAEISAGD